MKYTSILVANLAFTVSACANLTSSCSHWDITGYYTPVEPQLIQSPQHPDELQRITLSNQEEYRSTQGFLKEVKMEGWGKTRFGWYLGYYSGQWHKSSSPMDANGNPLHKGMVAVEQGKLAYGTALNIANVSDILKVKQFSVTDTGNALQGKHIDVYTGEGSSAKRASYKITGKHRVCVL